MTAAGTSSGRALERRRGGGGRYYGRAAAQILPPFLPRTFPSLQAFNTGVVCSVDLFVYPCASLPPLLFCIRWRSEYSKHTACVRVGAYSIPVRCLEVMCSMTHSEMEGNEG